MSQKIEFKSSDNAKNVAKHLYNVQLEGNCLVFSEFYEEAFDLAVALEGLEEKDYKCLGGSYDCINSDYNDYVERAINNLAYHRISNPQHLAWIGGYKVNIKLLKVPDYNPLHIDSDAFLFRLSSNLAPRISVLQTGAKELSVEITIEHRFKEFILILEQLTNSCTSLSQIGEIDRAVLTVKNIYTRAVQYFLTIFCDGQPQIVQFYPTNNVTIEKY